MESIESKMAVLIESVHNLSEITCNHDKLLTKLVDDHEIRLRVLQENSVKCVTFIEKLSNLESKFEKEHIVIDKRLRALENWRWYMIGIFAAIITGFEIYIRLK